MNVKLNALFSTGKKPTRDKTTYHNNRIKRHHMVKYHSNKRIDNLSEESIATKSLSKISTKLQFLHRQNEYLTPELLRLLCYSLIQSHFDYDCVPWYC